MTAFAPPSFFFPGLPFNKLIFEQEIPTTGSVIPSPLPITELDTNNIQPLTLGTPVTLYTTHDDVIQLGGPLVTNINIEGYEISTPNIVRNDGSSVTLYDSAAEIGIGAGTVQNLFLTAYTGLLPKILASTPSFYISSADNRYFLTQFNTAVDRINQYWRADRVNLVDTCSVIVTPSATPTIANTGTYSLSAGLLKTPNVIQSNSLTQVDLFQTTTGVIRLGTASSEVSVQAAQLTTPNTIVSYTPANQQNLFTTSTGDIVIAGASTGVRINSTVRTNIIVATTPASSAVSLYNNFTSGSSGSVALGNNFLPSITTRSVALSTHANTYNLRSNTTANQRIQQTFPFTSSTQQQFYVDNGNSAIITAEVTVTRNASTPTVDRTGTYQILAGTLDLGTGGSSTTVNGSLSTDTINAITPASSIINLFTNFTSLTTATIAFGNSFLVSLTTRAKSLVTYFDTYNLRSNTNANQRIEQSFPSTTTQRESFFIDNGNAGVETCRISMSQGATPLLNNTGSLTLTAGTASLTADTVNLSTTGASSVVTCNAQLVPKYAYNATTGVANAGAIGYTTYGVASTAGALTSGTTVLRSTVTIGVDGVYLICTNQAIVVNTAGGITRIASFADIYNGAGVFQVAVGVGNVPSIVGAVGRIFHMPWTTVYVVQGATVALPFTFRFRLEPVFAATISSTNLNFNFGFTRLA